MQDEVGQQTGLCPEQQFRRQARNAGITRAETQADHHQPQQRNPRRDSDGGKQDSEAIVPRKESQKVQHLRRSRAA